MINWRKTSSPIAVVTLVVLVLGVTGHTGAQVVEPHMLGGWQPGPEAYNPSRVIVRFTDAISTNAARDSIQGLGYSLCDVVEFEATATFPNGVRFGVVELPEGEKLDTAVNRLNAAPDILYAERDHIYYKTQAYVDTAPIPSDPHFGKQWGFHNHECEYKDPYMSGDIIDGADINMPEAWEMATGSGDLIVAIIDTGIYVDHPDLYDNIWRNPGEIPGNGIDDDGNFYVDDIYGWNFFNQNNRVFSADDRDLQSGRLSDEHGTHCAGVIGGVGNNAMGVCGVNWNVKIMSLKFIGPYGGETSGAIRAFAYARDMGAKIINCSWGGGPYNEALRDAIKASEALVICAASNEGNDNDVFPHYPSNYDLDNIISVAAMMQNETPCVYPELWATNYGADTVDLFAPGGFIISTIPPDPVPLEPEEAYVYMYGTSMAAPHVAGAAALINSLRPNMALYPGAPGWTPGQPTVKDAILETVDVKPAYEGKARTGGRLNVDAALAFGGPSIVSIDAQPRVGEPPLAVTFSAAIEAPQVPVTSYGWDFGDGTSSSELDTTHVYTEPGNYTATFSVTDELGVTAEHAFDIAVHWMPHATVDRTLIETVLRPKGTATETLIIGNTDGNQPLNYNVKVRRGSAGVAGLPEYDDPSLSPDGDGAGGLQFVFDPKEFENVPSSVEPGGIGDVILSWPAPPEIVYLWGLGCDNTNVWLGDNRNNKIYLMTPEGEFTDKVFSTPWAGLFGADMAYDSNHDLMWQVNVGEGLTDNGIYGMNPETGEVEEVINTGGLWLQQSQRGLGYDAETDTFYIGGWNDRTVYVIKGIGWDDPGEVIEQWVFPVTLAGLEYHPDGILWVSTSDNPSIIYGVDVASRTIIHKFVHPTKVGHAGASLALSSDSNLWVACQATKHVYLVNTQSALREGIVLDHTDGTIPEGGTGSLEVTFNAAKLGRPGQTLHNHLEITTDDPANPALFVDVIVHIEGGPTIVEAIATPPVGEPPLTVAFDATVKQGDRPITDMWWEFGDGSDPVHEAETNHVYEKIGTYTASFHVIDENDLEASVEVPVEVKWIAELVIEPEQFDILISPGSEAQATMTLSNQGTAPMNFRLAVAPSFAQSAEWALEDGFVSLQSDCGPKPVSFSGAGAGGPDQCGYIWIDNKQFGGPEFGWIEIKDIGTRINARSDDGVIVPLPFEFPYYGDTKDSVGICTNGYLTFDPMSIIGYWMNMPVPHAARPNDTIAVFWEDLYPAMDSAVYHYYDAEGDRFIIEWEKMGKWGAHVASYTFQVILYPDGKIIYQYLDMSGITNSATVGIENADGTDGLSVVFDAPYIEDELTIAFVPLGRVLQANPTSGYLLPGNSQDIVITASSHQADLGAYQLYLYVYANDPFRPHTAVPVRIEIAEAEIMPQVKILKPEAGAVWTGTKAIEYEAIDPGDSPLAIKLEYDSLGDDAGWQLIADGEENTGKYLWDTSKLSWGGIYKVRVTASDPDGGTGQDVSDEFTIVVLKRMVMAAPNPARDLVTFYYDIDTDGELFVYDVAGRLVHTAKLSATANSHEWNLTTGGRPVASGLYLYVVITDDAERSEVGRLVIERL